MNDPRGSITILLDRAQGGDRDAAEELYRRVEQELRQIVYGLGNPQQIRRQLEITAIVDDVFLKLVLTNEKTVSWQNRKHFYRAAAKAIRRIYIDCLRKNGAIKAGGGVQLLPLGEHDVADHRQNDLNLVELHDAIETLAGFDLELAEIADLHLFAGRTLKEIGDILGMSKSNVVRRWKIARAWLYGVLAHVA